MNTTPILELFSRLNNAGISLKAQDGQLRILAPAGALTPALREELLAHKTAVLDLLEEYGEGNRFPSEVIRRTEREGFLPLSFAQERVWFLDQLHPDSAVYNIPMGLRFGGALNVPVLRRCLNEILRRHESLRTHFELVEGQPVQVIRPEASLKMLVVDLRGLPKPEREAKAKRLCMEEAQRPFDLRYDLMLRAKLFRLGEAEHILFLNMHHIASDGWSAGLLVRELSILYEAFVEGKPSPLPELPVQYVDFAVWQRQWLPAEVLEKQLGYWRKQLEGVPALLELPTDHPRSALQSYRGALMPWELPKPLLVALEKLSRHEGATLFMILLASFQTLLHRYTSSDEILVGSPVAGRTQMEIEPLIGIFFNTLVLRGDLSGNPSFRTFLGRTREAALGAYAHQDVPFERLVDELQPERNMSHSPFFQVMFVLQNAPWEAAELASLEVTTMPIHSGTSKFDLTLYVREHGGVLHAAAEYNTDLFEAETIRRMLGHYQTLLEGIVANPDLRLSDLPLLTSAERDQILVDWNRTEIAHPSNRCLHELIEEQAERSPEAVAVVCEESKFTYRELNRRADELAHRLRALGVGPDVLVALFLERSLDMVVGMLGVLKAGGAYVPLDPTHPRERLGYMLADAQPLVLLTQARLQSKMPQHRSYVVVIDVGASPAALKHASAPSRTCSPRDLAYVIYTSGSTGKPKGVEIEHRAVVNMLASMQHRPGLGAGDTMLAVTTLAFDIAALEIFLPLACGASVVIASTEATRDGAALADLIKRCGVTVMQATPSTLRMLLDVGWMSGPRLKILCGGEAWTAELANLLLTRCSSLWNMYGPTETTVWSAVTKVKAAQPIVIGRPIANTLVHILDRHLQPTPIGVPGELHIGGIGLARGYHNRAELTAEKFIPNPFRAEPGARLYKTGDLARYLPNGAIEYLGRLDHQVKIRGFRIELGEIESVLAGLPGVREAVVVARENVPGDKRLVAYLTVKEAEPPKNLELRGLLQAKLPDYMVPSAFVTLDRLPLTPNGKVDRKALPASDGKKIEIEQGYVAPTTDFEQVLCRIWCERLHLERVGTRDNFFDLGGYSLMAVRIVDEIKKTLKVHLNVMEFHQDPTIERLARVLEQKRHVGPEVQVLAWQHGHTGLPLYFIGAGPVEYKLAQLIGEDRAIFATDLPAPIEWYNPVTAADRAALPTVNQLGTLYGDALREHAGSSPCVVVGYTFFGRVAFEAARALQRTGGKVAFVLLIDAVTWSGLRGTVWQSLLRIWRKAATGTGNDTPYVGRLSRSLGDSGRLLWWLLAKIPRVLKHRFWRTARRSGLASKEFMVVDVFPSFLIIAKSFHRRPLDASGVLIRAKVEGEERLPGVDFTNGWGDLFQRGLEVVQATGDHLSMVRDEQNIAALALQINAVLDRYDLGKDKRAGHSLKELNIPAVVSVAPTEMTANHKSGDLNQALRLRSSTLGGIGGDENRDGRNA